MASCIPNIEILVLKPVITVKISYKPNSFGVINLEMYGYKNNGKRELRIFSPPK